MHGKRNPVLKKECTRLRVEERKSYDEIVEITGVARSTLAYWLVAYPLTEEEKQLRVLQRERPKKNRGTESKYHVVIRDAELTRHQKSKIAEAAILFRLVLHQFIPYGPVFDGEKADWLVSIPNTEFMCKLQVKWARKAQHGLPFVSLHCTEGHCKIRRYKKGDFDFIIGYNLFNDTAYVWSWEETVSHAKAITVTEEAAERWDKIKNWIPSCK